MYNLPYFKEKDQQVVLDFIHQHPFAFIAGCSEDGKPVATQIPVFIDEREGKLFLSGHMMRNTDHHKAFEHNPNVLAVFTGAHTYVSASWYEDKKQGSTWRSLFACRKRSAPVEADFVLFTLLFLKKHINTIKTRNC